LPAKNLTAAARNKLLGYAFPGNVRELENVIQKAILLSGPKQIDAEDLQLDQAASAGETPPGAIRTLKEVRVEAEKKAIETAMRKTAGNVSLAAKLLDVDRKWLMKLMEEADIHADDFRK
jgi:DNA-binding NtrC family response regulator